MTTNQPTKTPPSDRDDIPTTEKPADVTPFPARDKTSKWQSPKPVAPTVTSKKWGLDMQALNRDLPPPGRQPGVMIDIAFKDRGSDLFMMLSCDVGGLDVTPRKNLRTLAANNDTPGNNRYVLLSTHASGTHRAIRDCVITAVRVERRTLPWVAAMKCRVPEGKEAHLSPSRADN